MATIPILPSSAEPIQNVPAVVETFDIDTYLDLGLHGCQSCYIKPSAFAPKHSDIPYLTDKIPAEVRNLIIEYAVLARGGNQPIKADYLTWRSMAYDEDSRTHNGNVPDNATILAYNTFLRLSKTCHLLNIEANAAFFGKNRFSFHEVTGMRIYLDNVSLRQRQLIQEVIFVYNEPVNLLDLLWSFDLLSQCPLRKLTMGLAGENNFEIGSRLRFPTEICVLLEHGILPAWNFEFKLVETDNWMAEDLDWQPAPLFSRGYNKNLLDLASDILSRKTTIADLRGPHGDPLRRGEQTFLQIIHEIESHQPGGLKDIAVRASQRLKGWDVEVINGSYWDRLGGATICSACYQKLQEAEMAKKSRKRRRPAKKGGKKQQQVVAVNDERSNRTMLGDVQNIARKPPGTTKAVSKR